MVTVGERSTRLGWPSQKLLLPSEESVRHTYIPNADGMQDKEIKT